MRAFLCLIPCLFFALSCSDKSNAPESTEPSPEKSSSLFPITVQLDWVPEPQHGGLFTAEAMGIFEKEGLRVSLVSGGPNANARLRVATGRAHFAQVEGNNAMLAIAEGLPLKIVAALFQHDPSVLLMHEDHPVNSFENLNGKQLKARPQWAFLDYLKKKYSIDFSITPVDFGLEVLAANKNTIQQGYYIAEPFYLEKMDVAVKWLHVWDAGYDGLSAIVANPEFLAEHPDKARAFLRAYYIGQVMYFEGTGDLAHEIMLKRNESATRDFLEWSRQQILEQKLARGSELRGGPGDYLLITPERIQKQIEQLVYAGEIERDQLSVEKVFDGRYLPQNYPGDQ